MRFQIEDDGEGPPSSAVSSLGAFRFRLQPFGLVVSTTSGHFSRSRCCWKKSLLKPVIDLRRDAFPQIAEVELHRRLPCANLHLRQLNFNSEPSQEALEN